ncbi:MCE family protein [Rhodococcus sp. IEGM 1381]|uniref:MCE family protein n=1 Tax=Rhodococcus sp. IEGM 1381 TaxID=3047085 RepID=UPI0024B6BEF4|nr:MCE family protein [Rhodococcus sp. IEGM 1381]MDI9896864.1 MCE family protein [Rhodococcus sp. IEGM 1381]
MTTGHRNAVAAPRIAAGVMAGLLLLSVAATYFAFTGGVKDAVDPPTWVTLQSDRSGLVMQPGALVKIHGVEVGTVDAVHQVTGGAVVELRLEKAAAQSIPENVEARIAATTIFGSKFVTLTEPANPSSVPISSGAIIDSSSVTVEVNTVFQTLTQVLAAVEPDKLNSTLTSLATAVRGRGNDLGLSIDETSALLAAVEPRVPTLQREIAAGATVTETLADAAPDLLTNLENLTTTGRTLVDKAGTLDAVLLGVIGMADVGNAVLSENAAAISSTVHELKPTTELLEQYSPEFTCFLQGADRARVGAEEVSGGNGRTMLLNSTILFGIPPYTYESDLPRVAASGGPRCGALPMVPNDAVPTPYVVADTGSNPFRAGNTGPVFSPSSILDFLPGGLATPAGTR